MNRSRFTGLPVERLLYLLENKGKTEGLRQHMKSVDAIPDMVLNDIALQNQARAVGGRWNKEKRVWLVPYGYIAGMKQEEFIGVEASADARKDDRVLDI